jgi:hypothetical protein
MSTYYLVLIPTYMFAAKMAATDTVVPKSASESIPLPDHDTAVWDKEYNGGLVQPIEHVRPELGLRIFETKDAAFVELGKGERSFGVDILVKGFGQDCEALVREKMVLDVPPRTITGREVNTVLYNKMKVYWYRYVASKLSRTH